MKQYQDVDGYLADSERWSAEIAALRPILLASGLVEGIKWGKPCYGHAGGNVVILQEMKDFLAVMFFKGALLSDPEGVLEEQGPNSRSARRLRVTSVEQVSRSADVIARYLDEAMRVEEQGLAVEPSPAGDPGEELQRRLDADDDLRAAFAALTPGRQREYNLYFSGAKRVATREARIDKCVARILDGRGLRDR